MRKIALLAGATSMAIALSSCALVPGSTPAQTESQVIADVIAACQVGCSFVPDAEAVGAIVLAGDPVLSTAASIANFICAQINAGATVTVAAAKSIRLTVSGAARMRTVLLIDGKPLIVDGITVTGHFVK